MRAVFLIQLGSLLLASGASAQWGPAPERDLCGSEARRIGARVRRAHGWSTPEPVVRPIGTLGRAVLWRARNNPRCCDAERGCSATSEREDALVATVGRRVFLLSASEPRVRAGAPGENRLLEPFVARGWSALIRAAGALPTSPAEAMELAWWVYASTFPGLGRVQDVATFDPELAAQARALGDLEPSAAPSDGGFEVSLWASRRSHVDHVRDRGMGSSSDQRLRRAVVRIHRDGTVTVLADVSVGGQVARRRAGTRRVIVVEP